MLGDIELAGLDGTNHFIQRSKASSQESLCEEDGGPRESLQPEQELQHGESSTTYQARDPVHSEQLELQVHNSQPFTRWKGKGRQLEARGHYYNNITASDNAYIHLGDVFFNYCEADSTEKRILDWLNPIDPSHSHHQACVQYRDGTFLWFFESGYFPEWQACSGFQGSEMVWFQGNTGTGKTTFIAQVRSRLRASGVPKGDIAVFYCQNAEGYDGSMERLLCSILAQLYQCENAGFDFPPAVEGAVNSQKWWWKTPPDLKQLTRWLHERLLATNRATYILLDALDSLPPASREKLIDALQSSALRQSPLMLMITSRFMPEDDVDRQRWKVYEMRAHKQDLRALVHERLHEPGTNQFQRLVSGKPARSPEFTTLEEEIAFKVTDAAQDMYEVELLRPASID